MKKVERKSFTDKANVKEEFELCYLRHLYVKKSKYNPSEEEMAPYTDIIKAQAQRIRRENWFILKEMGFELSDLTSIGQTHLISFLNLFSIEQNEEKFERFKDNHEIQYNKKPGDEDILDKNKADFTCFLKQRYQELIRLCRKKYKNVYGADIDSSFYKGKVLPERLSMLEEDSLALGFSKLDPVSFAAIRNKAKTTEQVFEFEGFFYVEIKNKKLKLNSEDFVMNDLDPRELSHHRNPEEILLDVEAEDQAKRLLRRKRAITPHNKELLKNFIDSNKNSANMVKEVKLAKRLLKMV